MAVPDDLLAEIDAEAIEVAKRTRRERIDREIAAYTVDHEEADAQVYSDWECTLADGLDEIE
jgi:hypothetical protein